MLHGKINHWPHLTAALAVVALFAAPMPARAAKMPAASFSGNFTVLACNGGKSASLKGPGSVSLSQSCTQGSASVDATAARTHFAVSTSQTATAGTSNVVDSGAVGGILFFEVVGPHRRTVPVEITFTGTLSGASATAASGVVLGTPVKTVEYNCGVDIPTVQCGGFTKTIIVKVPPVTAINPALASPVSLNAGVQGSAQSGAGAQTSSASVSVSLAIPNSFPHSGKYKLILSPGIANP